MSGWRKSSRERDSRNVWIFGQTTFLQWIGTESASCSRCGSVSSLTSQAMDWMSAMAEAKQLAARKSGRVSLRQQVLLAAVECSGGDLNEVFTAEDLLLAAWRRDPMAWGLRGHENEHPDSEKIFVELDRVSMHGR